MPEKKVDYAKIYASFQAPIAKLNCGDKCAPYNENHVPFCCDTRHAVPTAYNEEWQYLQENTDLWRLWQAEEHAETARLQAQTPPGQALIACKGHELCQRSFRSITCRAFPFFPYISKAGEFLGLSYYWEYEERCWVISHLEVVEPEYRAQFLAAYDLLFERMPSEKETFAHHSGVMRRIFGRRHRAIPLLHRNGACYKITPRNERMRRVEPGSLPKFGPYQITEELAFPDEISS